MIKNLKEIVDLYRQAKKENKALNIFIKSGLLPEPVGIYISNANLDTEMNHIFENYVDDLIQTPTNLINIVRKKNNPETVIRNISVVNDTTIKYKCDLCEQESISLIKKDALNDSIMVCEECNSSINRLINMSQDKIDLLSKFINLNKLKTNRKDTICKECGSINSYKSTGIMYPTSPPYLEYQCNECKNIITKRQGE